MPPSSLPRDPLTSSRTAQPKGYVYLLSGPSPNDALPPLFHPCETYLQGRLRVSLAAHPRAHPRPTSPPSTTTPTTLDGVTANADRTTFDAALARAHSAHLPAHGLKARPISWRTVPKGMGQVRLCLHAGSTRAEIDALVNASMAWAAGIAQVERACPEGDRTRIEEGVSRMASSGGLLGSKL